MPYNTRRKSLSLPSLGISIPSYSRRSASIPDNSNDNGSNSSINTAMSNKMSPAHSVDTPSFPPSKRRRVHPSPSQSPEPQPVVIEHPAPAVTAGGLYKRTPPPSPVPDDAVASSSESSSSSVSPRIDTAGINDDVVVAVIQHLEKTGNRPHLIKQLAAILLGFNTTVAK